MDKNKVYEQLLHISKFLARSKDGGLFVIGPQNKFKGLYEPLFPQLFTQHKLDEPGIGKVLEKLATLDGAVLVSDDGELLAYGAKIKKSKTVAGYGTKHAAAAGITLAIKESTAILISEEVNWIKVFQNGIIVLEMDSEENPRSMDEKIVAFLSEHDTALLTAGGISAAILGSAAVAPVMVIGGTYLAIKTATGFIKKNWKGKKNEGAA